MYFVHRNETLAFVNIAYFKYDIMRNVFEVVVFLGDIMDLFIRFARHLILQV